MTNIRRKSKPVFIKIVGLILSESYQRSRIFTERLHKHYKTTILPPCITGLLEMDWVEYLHKLRKNLGGQTWALQESVVVFLNGSFLGGEQELFKYFRKYEYKNPSPEEIKEYAKEEYVNYLNRNNLAYSYLELSLDNEYMGTLLFQLRYDLLPRSCHWFMEFFHQKRCNYEGTKIHRICRRGWFQAGEINPTSKTWSTRYLEDENYSYKHDRRGILSFANDGKHSNTFQFFVTFEAAEWMDGKYVAFGRLVEGADVLRRIECVPCTYESPNREIKIAKCGIAKVGIARAMDPTLKLKGITAGEPHIDFEFFIEILFSQFDRSLFDRLDDEVKKQIRGERMMELLWDKVIHEIAKRRPPVQDVLDEHDRSSVYTSTRYLAGLYNLKEIPDLYIKALMDKIIDNVIERGDIKSIANSVVNLIVDHALEEATATEELVEDIVESLIKEVFQIVFGSETELPTGTKDSSSSMIGIKKVLSEAPDLKASLADLRKRISVEFGEKEEQTEVSRDKLSIKESVVAYIWSILLETLQNVIVPKD